MSLPMFVIKAGTVFTCESTEKPVIWLESETKATAEGIGGANLVGAFIPAAPEKTEQRGHFTEDSGVLVPFFEDSASGRLIEKMVNEGWSIGSYDSLVVNSLATFDGFKYTYVENESYDQAECPIANGTADFSITFTGGEKSDEYAATRLSVAFGDGFILEDSSKETAE